MKITLVGNWKLLDGSMKGNTERSERPENKWRLFRGTLFALVLFRACTPLMELIVDNEERMGAEVME